MVSITAQRVEVSSRGCFSEIFDAAGQHIMWTAEHTYPADGDTVAPKVHSGTYTCQRGIHEIPTGERFDTFEVCGVVGHSGILFCHPGNLPQTDSDGCFLCGKSLGYLNERRAVIISRPAFEAWSTRMRGVDTFTLIVLDPQP